jgi:hypothetical protein
MIKQKTGYWKTHPLRKAITVLVGFYLILFFSYYCALKVPELLGFMCIMLFYLSIGKYVFGCLYGIWLDCSCHLKTLSFCFMLLVVIVIVSSGYFFTCLYPDWMRNGYIVKDTIRVTINLVYVPILSVIGGYILSRVISYIIRKKQDR